MKNLNKITLLILLKRLLITLGILLLIRVGSFLPIPGINHTDLALYIRANPVAKSIISTFSGEDTFVLGLFTLNIFPYINASILVQVLIAFSPRLSQLQKEGDLNARRSLNRVTRLITLFWSFVQSLGVGFYLKQILFDWDITLFFEIVIWLTTGSMIVLWLSELITDYGLGNGPSLLIYANIVSSFPNLYKKLFINESQDLSSSTSFIIFILVIISVSGIILLQDAVKKVPLISAKQLSQPVFKNIGLIDTYIPLKLNQAGVMPIIITTTLLVLPAYLSNLGLLPSIIFPTFSFVSDGIYWVSYYILILTFSSFYATIVLNPKDIADQLQKMAVTIPGVRPGIETNLYLKNIMARLTIIGSSLLAILATFPNLIAGILKIPNLNGLSTTSLLIMAGVLVDIAKEVEDVAYSNIYNKTSQKKY